MAEFRRTKGLLQERRRLPEDPAWTARQNPDLEVDPLEPLPTIERKPTVRGRRMQWVAAILVGLLASLTVGWVLLHPNAEPGSTGDVLGPRWKDESTAHFTFAAAADFGEPYNPDTIALVARARAAGASFLVALGDLGYPDEVAWCEEIRRYVPEIAIAAGSQDDGEGPPSSAEELAQTCPYSLPSPFVLGNGAAGYGYEYYFDYPVGKPLARFIMISAGLDGPFAYDYSQGSPHTEWMEDVVADGRDRGIPWVIVVVHKQCITVGAADQCSMGAEIFEELVEAGVDLILVGNDRVYARSKLLDESPDSCDSANWTDEFVPECVVRTKSPNAYPKGEGTVVVVQGVGGRGLDNVTIDGSDPHMGYFHQVMGQNANTAARLPGFGSVLYRVSADSIRAETDFCPPGRVAADGRCLAHPNSVFTDRFVISEGPSKPIPSLQITSILPSEWGARQTPERLMRPEPIAIAR